MFKFFLIIAYCLFTVHISFAQVSGGYGAGQQIPSPVDKASTGAGPISGNVDLFTGSLHVTYDFGTVSTISGLTFPVKLLFNSDQLLSFETPQNSGIPYGEGWQLATGSITVETNAFDFKPGDLGYQSAWGSQVKAYTENEAMQVGQLYFTNPFLNLPGGYSGRLVYKYPKQENTTVRSAVYVLQGFSTYIEAEFNGYQWVVRLDDGTEYVFAVAQHVTRNATFLNTQMDNDGQFRNSAVPKLDAMKWHLSEIRHPNHSLGQKIAISYIGYGKINMYPVLFQNLVYQFFTNLNSKVKLIPDDLIVYQDIYLDAVYSADEFGLEYERMEFIHRTWRPEIELKNDMLKFNRGKFLTLSDTFVHRIDSMYNMKTVWFRGEDLAFIKKNRPVLPNVNFGTTWRRYMHIGAHQNPLSNHAIALVDRDPYAAYFKGIPGVGSGSGGISNHPYRAHSQAIKQPGLQIPFTHSVIESQRIRDNELLELPSGDLYVLQSTIAHPVYADMNFDVCLVSGQFPGNLQGKSQNVDGTNFQFESALAMNGTITGTGGVSVQAYNPKGYRFYNSFNRMIKWNPTYTNGAWWSSDHLVTTDVFRMPNLPNSFQGFHIQVGPAADDLDNAVTGLVSGAYPFFYSNRVAIGTYGTVFDNVVAPVSKWFGSGAPYHGIFMEGRLGMGKQNDWTRGTHNGSMFRLFRHYPITNPFKPVSLTLDLAKQYGPNQPTSVTMETVKFGTSIISPVSNHTDWEIIHNPPQDASLINVELIRIAKNPFLLDSVIMYKRNGDFLPHGRIRKAVIKLDYSLDQVKILNGASPGYTDLPEVLPPDTFKIVNGQIQYRNIWKLIAIRRVGVDTLGDLQPATAQLYTKIIYKPDIAGTAYLNEGNLVSEIWNELGGRTAFEYDMSSNDTLTTGLAAFPVTEDMSGYVIAGGYTKQLRFPVIRQSVETESGWMDTEYSYGSDIVLDEQLGKDKHFYNSFNQSSRKNYTWGFDSTVVELPSVSGNGNARSVYYYHEKLKTISDTLLFGRMYLMRSYDESGKLILEQTTQYNPRMAYQSGWYFNDPQLAIPEYGCIETNFGEFIYPSAQYFDYDVQPRRYDSWFVPPGQVITVNIDPVSGLRLVDTLTYAYYDWDTTMGDPGGDYDHMYQLPGGGQYFGTQQFDFGGKYHPGGMKNFGYCFEPSWQLASETRTSVDMPCAFKRTEHYYLWDSPFYLLEFLPQYTKKVFDSITDFEHTYRPIWFCWNYGMRSTPVETREIVYYGDTSETAREVSTYYWYDQFPDVKASYVFTTDSTNYIPPVTSHREPGQAGNSGNDSLIKPMKEKMINMLHNQFFLRHTSVQITEDKYFIWEYTKKNHHNYYRPVRDKWNLYKWRYIFQPAWPVVETHQIQIRNMYGQILKETDIRRAEYYYSYKPGEWHTSWDTLGNIQYSVQMIDPGLPRFITISGAPEIDQQTAYKYYPNHQIRVRIGADGDTAHCYYDDHGRLSELWQEDRMLENYSYGNWGGGISYNFDQRTGQNFVFRFLHDDMFPGKPLVKGGYFDPMRRQAQAYSAVNSISGQVRRRYEAEVERDLWGRVTKSFRPVSLLTPNFFGYANNLPKTDFSESRFENNANSRVLELAAPTRSIAGGKTGKNEYSIITLYDFQQETGVSNLDILANFPCIGIPATGPTVTNSGGAQINSNLTGADPGTVSDTGLLVVDPNPVSFTLPGTSHANPSWTSSGGHQVVPGFQLNLVRIHKTLSEDEDGKKIAVYVDGFGRTLATMTSKDTTFSSSSRILTQFHYDFAGNLWKTVHPNQLSTTKKFNLQGWPYEVATPDAGTSEYAYLPTGEVALFQDENLRTQKRVLANQYDLLGRLVEVRTDSAKSFSCITGNYFMPGPLPTGHFYLGSTLVDFPFIKPGNAEDDSVDIYTKVPFPDWSYFADHPVRIVSRRYDHGQGAVSGSFWSLPEWPVDVHPRLKNYEGGMISLNTKLMSEIHYNDVGDPSEYTFFNYDKYGQIRGFAKQSNPGGIGIQDYGIASVIEYEDLEFRGKPWTINIDLEADSILDIQHHYQFDRAGQLEKVFFNRHDLKQAGNLIARYAYDEATGKPLQEIHYAASSCNLTVPVDTVCYNYDQMDRLNGLRSRTFHMFMFRDNQDVNQLTSGIYPGGYSINDKCWNGNLNGWLAEYQLDSVPGFDHPTLYGFRYDGNNQLTKADATVFEYPMPAGKLTNGFNENPVYGQPLLTTSNAFMGDEQLRHDKAGNITGLMRYHLFSPSIGQIVTKGENWIYQYGINSNRLTKLSTLGMPAIQFSHDGNGNLTTDSRQGLWGFEYNPANLPLQFYNGNGEKIRYSYGAGNQRIAKEVIHSTADTSKVYYLRDLSGQILATLDSDKKGWEIPVYGNGMIAEAFLPDSLIADSLSNSPNLKTIQTLLKRRNEVKKTIKILKDIVISAMPVAAGLIRIPNPEFENKLVVPAAVAIAPVLMHYSDRLIDFLFQNGDFMGSMPEWVMKNDNTVDSVVTGMKFFIYDHLGNVRVTYRAVFEPSPLCNPRLQILGAIDYYPYGRHLRSWFRTQPERWQTTRHERDAESNLDFRGARMYDSEYGRFMKSAGN